nr:hypothetical protein [Chloroflexaceae bacterium]
FLPWRMHGEHRLTVDDGGRGIIEAGGLSSANETTVTRIVQEASDVCSSGLVALDPNVGRWSLCQRQTSGNAQTGGKLNHRIIRGDRQRC